MTFDDRFVAEPYKLACLLWATHPPEVRVRFVVTASVLTEILKGGNPVHDDQNIALCERFRPKIEAACLTAFSLRPSHEIELLPTDFR